jgi:ribosomal protein L2
LLEEKRMPNVVDQWKFGGSATNGANGARLHNVAKGLNNSGPLKLLTVGSKRGSGRNNTGRITAYHRGGGSKQSYRHLDSFREYQFEGHTTDSADSEFAGFVRGKSYETDHGGGSAMAQWGRIVRLEYDPNRSGCIALVEWYSSYDDLYWYGGQSSAVGGWLLKKPGSVGESGHGPVLGNASRKKVSSLKSYQNYLSPAFSDEMLGSILKTPSSVSYILAMEGMVVGGWLYSKAKGIYKSPPLCSLLPLNMASPVSKKTFMDVDVLGGGVAGWRASVSRDFWSKPGVRLPLSEMVLGSTVCNVDGRYMRSAGSFGQVLGKEEATVTKEACVVVRFASGVRQRFTGSCLASVGSVSKRSGPEAKAGVSSGSVGSAKSIKKASLGLAKAGASRWRGRRPIVRGVAMNPVDHPHGGGEGRTSGGRPSVTPWGKLTKGQPTRKKSKPALQKENTRKGGKGR